VVIARAIVVTCMVVGVARADVDVAAQLVAIDRALPGCAADRAHCIAIDLHVAADANGAVASGEWLATQLAQANRHFAPLDVGFQLGTIDALPASAVRVVDRRERDALARGRLTGATIHVFVVGQLDNIDDPEIPVLGVTWRAGDRKYIILSVKAFERTLAHELGHFFGLPHSTYAISIMNKADRSEPPVDRRTFADEEIAAMRPVLRRMLRAKVVVDVKPR
jgi:hypothetical protein